MNQQSIEQQRASAAYAALANYQKNDLSKSSEYLSGIKSFAATVQQNGLGQTLAMYQASSTTGPQHIYQHLEYWARNKAAQLPVGKNDMLIEQLMNIPQRDYLTVQIELLAYARWLKKFAVASLTGREPDINTQEVA